MNALRMRTISTAVAAVVLAASPAGAAGSMPPQVPSAREMAALHGQLSSALGAVRAVQGRLDAAVAEFEGAYDGLAKVAGETALAERRLRGIEAEMRASQASINDKASRVYRSERVGLLGALVGARSFRQFVSAIGFLEAVNASDARVLGRLGELRPEAARLRAEVSERKAAHQALIAGISAREREIARSLDALAFEYEKVRGEVERRKSRFAFPVAAPYSYSGSWGAPRMLGTSYAHRHEGTDIFARSGTPVVAVVDGIVERVGTAALGGIKLWMRSPGDNWSYYYAHLSGFAPGITEGLRVKKGDVLGYVGNTGNARGTPPHLHFETHVPSGAPVDPYPILRRVDPLAR